MKTSQELARSRRRRGAVDEEKFSEPPFMRFDFMMIAGARQAPYQTRVGGECAKNLCVRSAGAAGIRGPSQDFVVRRGDLEYQRLVQPQALQSIALAVAEARSVNLVLQRIVEGLAGQPETALARIWLRGPGISHRTTRCTLPATGESTSEASRATLDSDRHPSP